MPPKIRQVGLKSICGMRGVTLMDVPDSVMWAGEPVTAVEFGERMKRGSVMEERNAPMTP